MKTLQAKTHNSRFKSKVQRFNHQLSMKVKCIFQETRSPLFQKNSMNRAYKQLEAKKNLLGKKGKVILTCS